MRKILVFTVSVLLFCNCLIAQEVSTRIQKSLETEHLEFLQINKRYSENATIVLSNYNITTLSAIFINGNIHLNSDSSFVRITIEDKYGYEYLILEANALTFGQDETLNQYFEESIIFNELESVQINIQITDATINIDNFPYIKHLQQKNNIREVYEEYRESFSIQRIANINNNLQRKHYIWYAGETSISKLTYQEKKELFGGKLPNLFCIEYYKGGVYEFPNKKTSFDSSESKSNSTIVDEFDWRNRHGRNWNTSVKQQISGTCWAYTTCAVTESCANLYFNRKLDLDLSEFSLVGCTPMDCVLGGSSFALSYVSTIGIMNQECFPNGNCNASCSDSCSYATERIFSNGMITFNPNNYQNPEFELKKHIIKYGVGYCSISQWQHAMALSGFGTINVNDTIVDTTSAFVNIIIQNGDNRIGKTYWILKNSWGTDWGHNGYCYLLADVVRTTMGTPTFLKTPIRSRQYYPSNILCEDRDGDGYYNWGIGERPSTCPDCALDDEDGDDSDPTVGPMDEFGNLQSITPYTYPETTIVGTVVVSNTDTMKVCGNLTINASSTLVITGNSLLLMPNHSTITIKNGGKLIVTVGRIKNSNIFVECGGELQLNNAYLMKDFNDEIYIEQGGIFNFNNGEIEEIGDSTMN